MTTGQEAQGGSHSWSGRFGGQEYPLILPGIKTGTPESSVSYSSRCLYEGIEVSGGKIPLISNPQLIISTQETRQFSAEVKNKWSNISTNPPAFVLCIGANVTFVREVRRSAVCDYSQDTFLPLQSLYYIHLLYLYRTLLCSRKVTDSNLGPETGHSDPCLLWIYSVLP